MGRLVALIVLAAACKPDAGAPLSLVTAPRVLALAGEPAEVSPGATTQLGALVASPDGSSTAPLIWSLCTDPAPSTTNDVVAQSCLSINDPGVMYLAYDQPTVMATVPMDACQIFGPELPPSEPGQPDRRPVDADATGGWYQPYRVDLASAFSVGLERIRCNLVGASMDVAMQFRMSYQPNQNPTIAALTVAGAPADGATVAPGAHVAFELSWPDAAVESYPIYNVVTQTLDQHREQMTVSWFATDGQFDDDRTGRASDDLALFSDDGWTAPEAPSTVHVWAVLRDDRGGAAWTSASVVVGP